MSALDVKLKKIPSTIQRGRMSSRQQHIFNTELANYCLDLKNTNQLTKKELNKVFGRSSELILDIGFGNGDQLLQLCEELPLYDFIGVELYKKGIANLISKIQNKNLNNLKIIYGDATEILQNFFDNHSLSKIQIFFPDPWPKTRHYKRRMIQDNFINIIKNKLLLNGILHIATDSDDYADHIIKTMAHFSEFHQLKNHNIVRPITKFEKIAISLGNNVWDIVFVLKSYIGHGKEALLLNERLFEHSE